MVSYTIDNIYPYVLSMVISTCSLGGKKNKKKQKKTKKKKKSFYFAIMQLQKLLELPETRASGHI